jgi:hypothetical protein
LPTPCHNGAICIDGVDSFTCQCLPGFTGSTCSENINDCDPNPCHNGQCIDSINDYNCRCETGYMGKNCDEQINPCLTQPCDKIHAICIHTGPGTHMCQCHPGYETQDHGETCTNTNDCILDACSGHGTCHDLINSYTCECHGGWVGEYCDVSPDVKCGIGRFKDTQEGCKECSPGQGPFPLLSEDATSCVPYIYNKERCQQLAQSFENEQCEFTCANHMCGLTKYEHQRRSCCNHK